MWGLKKKLPATIFHPTAGEVRLKIHARSTRLRLSLRLPNQFCLTVPPGTSLRSVQAFLLQTDSWIQQQLAKVDAPSSRLTDQILFQGLLYTIQHQAITERSLYKIDPDQRVIILDAATESTSQRLAYVCRKEFQKRIPSIISYYENSMGLKSKKVSVRDTKSRWGSCSGEGNISLCWRLVMAPADVMTYVIIHELAHLKHMNHSPEFWQLVSQYCPAYRLHKQWLKDNGHLLMAV